VGNLGSAAAEKLTKQKKKKQIRKSVFALFMVLPPLDSGWVVCLISLRSMFQ
jgi:hypothetical protein